MSCRAGRASAISPPLGCTGAQRRMPCRSTDCLQTPGSLTLIGLLCIWLLLFHLQTANCYFMAESKAEFLQGCGDYWTSLEQVPVLVQVTICMEVRVLSPGPWTAFTYSSPDSPLYDLALRGDGRGLEVWLLGVKHHFPVSLKSHLWHHICLRRDGHTLLLEVDDWADKCTVTSQAIPPSGELLLGCKGERDSQRVVGQVELYLFRMWKDMAEHSFCEDGEVVSWDSRKWAVAGTAKIRDNSLPCGRRRAKREEPLPTSESNSPDPTVTPTPVPSSNHSTAAATTTNSAPIIPIPPTGPANSSASNEVLEQLDAYKNRLDLNINASYSSVLQPVQCNFSQFCADDRAYYWMPVAVNTSNGKINESEISSWLSELFASVPCMSPSHDEPKATDSAHTYTDGLFSTTSSSSEIWTGSVTASYGPSTQRKMACRNGTASQLQGIDVACDGKNQTRTGQCSVLLQLSQPVDTCLLSQMLQEGGGNGSIYASLLGEVERVGKGLCLIGDMLTPNGRLVKCISPAPLSEVCSAEGLDNVTCKAVESVSSPVEPQHPDSQLCSSSGGEQHACDCAAFCGDTAMYYTVVLNITSPSLSMADLQNTISELSSPPPCNTSDDSQEYLCVLMSQVSQLYQVSHLECHGMDVRLYSCMVMLKLAGPLDTCSVSAVLSSLLQNDSAITFNGLVTRTAICGWPSESAADLLNSSFTWVSTDLNASQICTLQDPSVLTCQDGETLGILLNESCTAIHLPTPKSTENITTTSNTTQGSRVESPRLSAQNITTPYPANSKHFKTTTAPPKSTTKRTTAVHNKTVAYTTYPRNTNSTDPPGTRTTAPKDLPPAVTTTTTSTVVMTTGFNIALLLNETQDPLTLNISMVGKVVSRLEEVLSSPDISLSLGHSAIAIISNLLGAPAAALASFSTRIIRIVDTVGLKLVLPDTTETISANSLAVAVTKIDASNFQQTSFFVSDSAGLQIKVTSEPKVASSSEPLGSITLPSSLTDGLTPADKPLASRIQFNYYLNGTLFQDRNLGSQKLNSGVLGTSVGNLSMKGLKDDVIFTLRNAQPPQSSSNVSCVFWDFQFNGGSGGWNTAGCSVQNKTDEHTVCSCNHLTSFAVLLDISRGGISDPVQNIILTFITYIGCGVSAIFLCLTLLTYLGFEKLRRDIPSKILIQLSLALLMLNLVFLLDSWLALYPQAVGLCISTAFFLHYFLLTSFTWMGLEAFHMYLALVKVFNNYVSRYMLKFSLIGWGVPLVVVIIVIAINKDNYGLIAYGKYTDGSTDDFCWLKNDTAFYVAVVGYFCLVFLLNSVMFVVVLVQLHRVKRQNPHNVQQQNVWQELRSVAGLTVLLGLTWGFAFFAWGPVNLPFMYLFAIFNTLQGLFIFIFHCAIKDNVRQQWRTYLCCGRLRLAENSDWSRTATQNTTLRHTSVITMPSIHSGNTFSTSLPASEAGSTRRSNGGSPLPLDYSP
ncbi:uncharacterized protein LOC125739666 isoform X2 [Brienomyrus brachyistius]|uniref:uncharacterized protein LOC125739666 isoform X2 n=1 Tax=Brienomyrus brachyistius TaxID=42636 RepID=UPI0020B36B00|nr:uncharacterized protein LOC125739666 isoform X2 [Brienomyrus brachyistius]